MKIYVFRIAYAREGFGLVFMFAASIGDVRVKHLPETGLKVYML